MNLMRTVIIFGLVCLLVAATAHADDVLEENDLFATAVSIDYTTYNLSAEDEDWFKITANPGTLFLQMAPDGGIDVNLTLYNSSQQVLKTNYAAGTETIQYHVVESGTYYIQVNPTSATTTTYTLTVAKSYSASVDDANDDGQGNDSIEQAVVLDNDTTSLTSQVSADDDWFKVTTTGGSLTVDVLYDDSGGDIALEVYNSSFVRVNDSGTNGVAITGGLRLVTTLASGDYYFVVVGDSGNTYDLTLDIPDVVSEDSFEPNNEFASAQTITVGTHALTALDEDWFKIVANPGLLYLKMEPSNGVDVNMVLINASQQDLEANWVSGTEEIQYHLDTAGTYYIKVYPTAAVYTTYQLTVATSLAASGDDDYDGGQGNDSIEQAVLLDNDTTSLTSQVAADDDWFKVATSGGSLTVDVLYDDAQGDITLEVYDSSLARVNDSGTNGAAISGGLRLVTTLESGTYYFVVVGESGNNYDLSLDIPPTVTEDSYEPNNEFASARTITAGTHALTARDEDWFKISVNPGLLYLKMEPSNGADLNMVLLNASQQDLEANWVSGTEEIQYHLDTAGTYYIRIYPTAAIYTTYQLTVATSLAASGDDDNDSALGNDSIENPAVLAGATTTVTGQKAFDDDWFKVKVYAGLLTVDLLFDSSAGDIKLEVYDGSFTRIADSVTDEPTSSGRSLEIEVLDSDFYYIVVFAENGNSYSLGLDLPTLWTTPLSYGPISDVSIALFDIDDDGKDEIFVGTGKGLDESYAEVLPAGLICLEDDGTVKWDVQFPAMSTADPQTGLIYTTTSVGSTPAFGDIDGDGEIEIVVGVGADTSTSDLLPDVVGQPGDKGGVYALDASGNILWFHESDDIIGGSSNVGEGRPDGVYSSPVIFDLDSDGHKEVIYGGWDQNVYVLNGATGQPLTNWPAAVLDTIWATFRITDIDDAGGFEILVNADITENTDAQTQTGGIFHIFDDSAQQTVSGFDQLIGNPSYTTLIGKYEEQVLWSSPVVADLDGDGYLEIAYGTGNFFQDTRGSYIRIWNHDGTQRAQLSTQGRTFATPVFCDLEGDGDLEIVATTLDGYVYGWDHKGTQLFATQTRSFKASAAEPIFSSPLAVDINDDGYLEILYGQGAQIVVVDHEGYQLSSSEQREFVFEYFKGSPAVKDIDGDGQLDIISGGTTSAKNQAVVYRWRFGTYSNGSSARYARRQFHQSTVDVENFVKRFYVEVLNRAAEPAGLNYWSDKLLTGLKAGADVAAGFINSAEFINRGLSDSDYLDVLYAAFFDRAADAGGKSYWLDQISAGASRSEVLDGFVFSTEFDNLASRFGILPSKPDNPSVALIRSFVTRFYQQCLEREPDSGGLEDWTYYLINQTQTGSDVAFGFVFSQEFINRGVDDDTYLTILYRAFFNREPDTDGYNSWLSQLSQGTSRESVLNGFLGAQEFTNLSESYGIKPR